VPQPCCPKLSCKHSHTLVLPAHRLFLQADIAHDHKAAQLEDGTNTLLGLDANRLCKWDLRDPCGVVQVGRRRCRSSLARRAQLLQACRLQECRVVLRSCMPSLVVKQGCCCGASSRCCSYYGAALLVAR
jgi:hypothetical protein